MIEFELTFSGEAAEHGLLEFYDASRALAGFQRSLALTTHLAVNGEIITQAPAAKGFEIFIPPFEKGSWKSRAIVVFGAAVTVGSVGKDSPIGQMVTSMYDLALYNTMGFHVDYDKTLQQQYFDHLKLSHIGADKAISAEKIDSLCEKIEASVADMHRPIVVSHSASQARVSRCDYSKSDVGPIMTSLTYEYVKQTKADDDTIVIQGYVSSYNINTFKGRIYSLEENRPISFELHENSRQREIVGVLTQSQHINGQNPFDGRALVEVVCRKMISANGKVKRYIVLTARTV